MSLSNIRLGGSTFSFMWQEPAQASLERMQVIGLNDFDVLAVPGHLWFDAATVAGASRLRRQLEQCGIRMNR